MRSILKLGWAAVGLIAMTGCPSPVGTTDDGGTTDAGRVDAGTTDAGTTDAGTTDGGIADAGIAVDGVFRLSLRMEYRDSTLRDGGMGRGLSVPPDGGLLVVGNGDVRLRPQDGGLGLDLVLADGGACCGVDGPRFEVRNGRLVFPEQRYVLPPGIPLTLNFANTQMPMVTPWTLEVVTWGPREAAESSRAFRFDPVATEAREDGNGQPAVFDMSVSLDRP